MTDALLLATSDLPPVERTPVPGPSPVRGAQWDEVRACWERWDDASGHWVVVADALSAGDEREPASLDELLAHAPELRRDADGWVVDLRTPRG